LRAQTHQYEFFRIGVLAAGSQVYIPCSGATHEVDGDLHCALGNRWTQLPSKSEQKMCLIITEKDVGPSK
jgi:hypothetical protein